MAEPLKIKFNRLLVRLGVGRRAALIKERQQTINHVFESNDRLVSLQGTYAYLHVIGDEAARDHCAEIIAFEKSLIRGRKAEERRIRAELVAMDGAS